ncbi:hypothetical protein D3C76_1079910 [compost metagenome]
MTLHGGLAYTAFLIRYSDDLHVISGWSDSGTWGKCAGGKPFSQPLIRVYFVFLAREKKAGKPAFLARDKALIGC